MITELTAAPEDQGAKRHWLLDWCYGRELLKEYLRQTCPHLRVSMWREHRELDSLLDDAIDALGVREWRQPSTLQTWLDAWKNTLRLALSAHCGVLARGADFN